MKLSHLKNIIAEQVRQLQNQKQSLNEAENCTYFMDVITVPNGCPPDENGHREDMVISMVRHEDCSWDVRAHGCPRNKPTYGNDPRLNIEPTQG